MAALHVQPKRSLRGLEKKLVKLERSGRYESALAHFGEDWAESTFLPEPDSDPGQTAESLLRFGGLLGFHGFKYQINGSQERSKDIVMDARGRFIELGRDIKTAECDNYIALAYWRTGEYREAEIWADEALSFDLPPDSDTRLFAHVIKSLVLMCQGFHDKNIAFCQSVEDDFRKYGDAFVNGCLSTNIGLSYKNTSQNPEAMRYFMLARYFHEKSGHKPYLGTVHNNLAILHKTERRFDLAHQSADLAIALYKQIRDKTREASTIDTKALIFLAERRYTDALAAADKSIAILRKSEFSAYLTESITTRAKILLLMDRFEDAMLSLVEAINITRVNLGEDAARAIIREFEIVLGERDSPDAETKTIDTSTLELALPAELSGFPEYKGVWIKTDHLQATGILSGSLAIFVPGGVKRGELAAVTEIASGEVICGYFDSEFGIVCLERGDDDPQLFSEDEISVLGRIIGVCNSGVNADGKMDVEPVIKRH